MKSLRSDGKRHLLLMFTSILTNRWVLTSNNGNVWWCLEKDSILLRPCIHARRVKQQQKKWCRTTAIIVSKSEHLFWRQISDDRGRSGSLFFNFSERRSRCCCCANNHCSRSAECVANWLLFSLSKIKHLGNRDIHQKGTGKERSQEKVNSHL